jgi:hypothetical protein
MRDRSIAEALNKFNLDFSQSARQVAWALPSYREQWLKPSFAAAHPRGAGTSELVQADLGDTRA